MYVLLDSVMMWVRVRTMTCCDLSFVAAPPSDYESLHFPRGLDPSVTTWTKKCSIYICKRCLKEMN